jgi:pSer/pThr/pTyr-binding forkhead associated (FHA) protein
MSKPPPPPLHLGGTAASPHSTGADGPPPPPFSSSSATSTTQPHHSASTPNGNANHPHPGSSASSSPSSAGTTQGAATTAPTAAQPAAPPAYPALHLTPLNGTFVPKQISLDHTTSGGGGGRVKIGRQINAKTVPNATNGYFDSKVLSRAHAEVWSEDGKVRRPPPPPPPAPKVSLIPLIGLTHVRQVFIKDVKSSNGTFINGERLSPESTESDVFELHTDDIVVRCRSLSSLGRPSSPRARISF